MSLLPLSLVIAQLLSIAPEGVQGREYRGVTVVTVGVEGVAPAEAIAPAEDPGPPENRGYASALAPTPLPVPTVSSPNDAEATAEEPTPGEESTLADGDDLDFEIDDDYDGDDYEGDDYDPLRDSPEAMQAAGWVRSGIIFTVVGSVLAVGGVLMALSDPKDLVTGNGSQKTARDRAALTMGIPGGMMLVGGAAMIVVGRRQKKRLRASLQVLRRGAGIGINLRF
ncbi:MAG TPA: hypothetical protein ENJ18_06445 [Nannocystis exedens]|nr:hypothetical protein [Nannocystis exedens]